MWLTLSTTVLQESQKIQGCLCYNMTYPHVDCPVPTRHFQSLAVTKIDTKTP